MRANTIDDLLRSTDRTGAAPEHRPDLGPCWLWTGQLDASGYGKIKVRRRMCSTHTYAYVELVGPVPDGLQLDHICHDPAECTDGDSCPHRACVNPDHLEPVPQRENTLRGGGPTAINARKTHCIRGHEFTTENTYRTRTGGRRCRRCDVVRSAQYRARKGVAA